MKTAITIAVLVLVATLVTLLYALDLPSQSCGFDDDDDSSSFSCEVDE